MQHSTPKTHQRRIENGSKSSKTHLKSTRAPPKIAESSPNRESQSNNIFRARSSTTFGVTSRPAKSGDKRLKQKRAAKSAHKTRGKKSVCIGSYPAQNAFNIDALNCRAVDQIRLWQQRCQQFFRNKFALIEALNFWQCVAQDDWLIVVSCVCQHLSIAY